MQVFTLPDILYLGARSGPADYYIGLLDEVRLSNIARSSNWITTEYNNQYEPSTFYSVGNEEENSNWWIDNTFQYRKDFVINNAKVSADLSNFPILIDITDGNLKSGKIQPDADDIMFTDQSGVKLDHEIEYFQQNSSHVNNSCGADIKSIWKKNKCLPINS